MTTDEIIKYCLLKNGAYLDFPFGDIPICVKVASRLFAQIYPKPEAGFNNKKLEKLFLGQIGRPAEEIKAIFVPTAAIYEINSLKAILIFDDLISFLIR